jgi:FkbM family methyltransferase
MLSLVFVFSFLGLFADDKASMLTFVREFVSPGALVFDVGAHVGNKSAVYLSLGAHVVCIEPQPFCIAELKKRYANNPAVSIEGVGLAENERFLDMQICSGSTTLSTCSSEWTAHSRHRQRGYFWDKVLTIPVKTLDQIIKKYGVPDFCKIDVENFELEVFRGLSRPIPCISFEFHTETFHNAIACLDYLENLGYNKFNFAAGEYPQFILNEWVIKQEIIQRLDAYKEVYLKKEKDPLWGDIYARYP